MAKGYPARESGRVARLQLERHFKQLRNDRWQRFGDKPIFALEHGLDEGGLADLTSAIRQDISHSSPSRGHSLAWIVYAAELGYRYFGDEYWQTFESETPGWSVFGDRYWIRACFRWFHKRFGGARQPVLGPNIFPSLAGR